jgi:uncharacterized damage-inducible protein DinB
MKKIARPEFTEHAMYYEQYINKIDDSISVLTQMKDNCKLLETLLLSYTDEQLCIPYAPGKWSLKDLLVHIIDCERVFVYRAMRFARNDKSPLPFFDENEFAKEAKANNISIKKLLKEYKTTRQATIAFFNNLPASVLKRHGIASSYPMSVRACAWIIVGHEIHHMNVMKERYFPFFEENK